MCQRHVSRVSLIRKFGNPSTCNAYKGLCGAHLPTGCATISMIWSHKRTVEVVSVNASI